MNVAAADEALLADNADVRAFADTVRRILAVDQIDPAMPWLNLCAAGVAGLGRSGHDAPLLVAAMSEIGYAGAAVPLLGAVAAHALLPSDACILADVEQGTARIAVAFSEADGDRLAGGATTLVNTVSGKLGAIEDITAATHLLVVCDAEASVALILAKEPGIEVTPTPGFTEPSLSELTLRQVHGTVVAIPPGRAQQLVDLSRALVIARAAGAQRRALELAIDHVSVRSQFGKVIGSFQAVQHTLAECRVRADLAELLLADAAAAFGGGDVGRAVATLVSVAAPALRRGAVEIQHVLGAIGYAEEHEAPALFRRVHGDTARFGGTRRARALLASRLLDENMASFPLVEAPLLARQRQIFRDWLNAHWSDAERVDPSRNRDADPQFRRDLAAAGWLAASWPMELGGPGFDGVEQFVFLEEMRAASAPMTLISPTAWIVGPAIAAFGSAALKDSLLPAIARGDMTFCLGYSEPHAGSDLAALDTRAMRNEDHYVVTGQKIWTSLAEYATHIFLAVRTSTEPRKQDGISVLVVPLTAPGVTIRLMDTLQGKTFANIFFDGVRVPAAMRLGREGDGWSIITSALAAERIIMGGQVASLRTLFSSLVKLVRGRPDMVADAVVRERLAALAAELSGARALALRSAELVSGGGVAAIEGAITKLFSGDLAERIGEAMVELFGIEATLAAGANGALLNGAANQHVRTALMLVIGGGTAEIQRTLIAQRGMGLPR